MKIPSSERVKRLERGYSFNRTLMVNFYNNMPTVIT